MTNDAALAACTAKGKICIDSGGAHLDLWIIRVYGHEVEVDGDGDVEHEAPAYLVTDIEDIQ